MKGVFGLYSAVYQVAITAVIFLIVGIATLIVGKKLFSLFLGSFAGLLTSLLFVFLFYLSDKGFLNLKGEWLDRLGLIWPFLILLSSIIVFVKY